MTARGGVCGHVDFGFWGFLCVEMLVESHVKRSGEAKYVADIDRDGQYSVMLGQMAGKIAYMQYGMC